MLFAKFSASGEHVYCFSSSKNLYIYDKKSGKLVSLIMIPLSKTEVKGMLVGFDMSKREESMIVYDCDELFKLDSNV
jgi:hypothetical protein